MHGVHGSEPSITLIFVDPPFPPSCYLFLAMYYPAVACFLALVVTTYAHCSLWFRIVDLVQELWIIPFSELGFLFFFLGCFEAPLHGQCGLIRVMKF